MSVKDFKSDELALVSQLAAEMATLSSSIAAKEAELKDLQQKYSSIETQRLPEAMSGLGLTALTLSSGEKLSVGPEYHAGIPVPRRSEAYTWLRDNGLGDLITNKLSVEFGKGEDEQATELFTELTGKMPDRPVMLADSIHHSRLRSLVKERFEAGDPVPEDLFGVFIINRAKITAPKTRGKE